MSQTILMKIDGLIEGQVIKRPSKYIKTPYVADILCDDNEYLGHSASLGCCGLADTNALVLVAPCSKLSETKPKNKANMRCSHTIYLSVLREKNYEQVIGIYPKLAETLTETALNANLLTKLHSVQRYRRETSIVVGDIINSRFDFTGVDKDGIPFIMEVKNVPLADYEDITAKEKMGADFSERDYNSKIAYFPDGYRKKSADTVSPRALKHIKELTLIKKETRTRCIMCYVIQRTDVNRFQPSIVDPEYRQAFKEAVENGVEIITMVISWNKNGEAIFIRDDLPVVQF